MGERISEPNIYLFAFHLTEGFNATGKANNLDLVKDRFLKILKEFQVKSLPDLHAPTNYSIPIEGEVYLEENPHNPDIDPLIVKGFVHPLDLRDSYAFGLNIGCPEPTPSDKYQDIDITQLEKFHPNCFLPNFVESSLGQTLLITAKLTIAQKQKGDRFIRDLADKCVKNFIPSAYPNTLRLDRYGELFGSPIFEYGNPNQPDSYIHVIVWLFSDPETETKFGECYQDFLILLFYRNKIIQSYKNSRDVKIAIADDYQKIEEQIDKINGLSSENLSAEELRQLKTQLKELPKIALEYAQMLRDLEDYRHTIALNDRNYLDTIDRVVEKITLNYQDALNKQPIFLTQFSQKNSSYFQEQIQGKLGYFVHGSGLLDKAIASIRGIVEIEQAEIDRNLQTTIAVVGAGIGVAGVVATSAPYWIDQKPGVININKPFSFSAFATFILIIVISLGSGLLTWKVATNLINRKPTNKKMKPQSESTKN
ncbi:hypothetical protein [Argonema galeatum]|uniref:hypothetical protein n=1 Tax=Argonema galeatum TaxID=2942762 RepID=UPI0020137E2B|nr:hypothetical protein [Argonema galeatum]MCL1468572.1 hypothetical protein [Argonema galeatum A003/A1]